jgi:hypothetical protein
MLFVHNYGDHTYLGMYVGLAIRADIPKYRLIFKLQIYYLKIAKPKNYKLTSVNYKL